MQTAIDLFRRLSDNEGSCIRRVIENSVGSLKRRVNLSLIDTNGKMLMPNVPADSVDELIRGGLLERDPGNAAHDISIYRLAAAGIARCASETQWIMLGADKGTSPK